MMRSFSMLAVVGALALSTVALAAESRPTYSKNVAPILNANCVNCHRPGDIAPMSLMNYDEVRPWAKSIMQNVQSGVMPPWHADPGYGPFKGERVLSQNEIDTIVRWAKRGAPEGDKSDLPPERVFSEDGWKLGEPDFILEFDPVDVTASGRDQFVDLVARTNFDEDKWIRAVEILPSDRSVVHHVILWQGGQTSQDGWIGAWAAGAGPMQFPEGTGRLLRKGESIIGDMHYHPSGTATTDRTQVAFYFSPEEEVDKQLVNLWVINSEFSIPAGDPNYEARSTHTFSQDSRILTLTPHMHYRGKDFRYMLTYPDGKQEELLKVSKYDFNWQTVYEFEEPIAAPKGSRIDCVAHWDNSEDNPANPDPTKTVTFGLESYDEMMIGFVDYVVDEGVAPVEAPNPITAKLAELGTAYPGEVFKVMIRRGGPGLEPTALHLPREGNGGWYVRVGSFAGKAPITDILWSGASFTAIARIPGDAPQALAGSVEEGVLTMEMTVSEDMNVPMSGEVVQ